MVNGKTKELIIDLLKRQNLPYEDISSSNVAFITEGSIEDLKGCVGIEKFGKHGLMRSLAVDDSHKNRGLGKKLIDRLVLTSKSTGITRLHLLTTTASDYFLKYGFKESQRNKAPKAILSSKEFSELCPSNSIYMVLDI